MCKGDEREEEEEEVVVEVEEVVWSFDVACMDTLALEMILDTLAQEMILDMLAQEMILDTLAQEMILDTDVTRATTIHSGGSLLEMLAAVLLHLTLLHFSRATLSKPETSKQ